jgi:hypothetical protein
MLVLLASLLIATVSLAMYHRHSRIDKFKLM